MMFRFIVRFTLVLILILAVFIGWRYVSRPQIPQEHALEIPAGLGRFDLAKLIGKTMGWSDKKIDTFAFVYSQMQWAEYNAIFSQEMNKRYAWSQDESDIFLINSTIYLTRPPLDFFFGVYEPGMYSFMSNLSAAEIAGMLMERVQENHENDLAVFVGERLSETSLENVRQFVRNQYELLPDLLPLPPHDLRIKKVKDKIQLAFTTVYYNQGRGPLELRVDKKTASIRKDVESDVFQRIYLPDGTYRDRVAGVFLWHQSHLHYHFADFITYDLEAVDVEGEAPDLSGLLTKSTFCVRDMSRVDVKLEHAAPDAVYEICGKEKQGISVGWGDSYFYTYPDQNLDITNLPSGVYRLTFVANPESLFDEITHDNNTSSVLMHIDKKAMKVNVLESVPSKMPEFEHVYPVQQDCDVCTL